MSGKQGKQMGRPIVYDPTNPRRGHLLQLTDELWEALGNVASNNITKFIEDHLREISEVSSEIERNRER